MTDETEITEPTAEPVETPETPDESAPEADESAPEADESAPEADESAPEADGGDVGNGVDDDGADDDGADESGDADDAADADAGDGGESSDDDDSSADDGESSTDDGESSTDGDAGASLGEVVSWWEAWGQLRGYLVSATDRGQPHPEMAATAETLTEQGATVDALAVWVPTPAERSRLERSRRTVNAASDAGADANEALEKVRSDLGGDEEVWIQLLALAEAWINARRAGKEPERRGRRKGRNRGRGRDRDRERGEKKAQAEAQDDKPEEKKERGGRRDRKRRRGRRRRPALPQGNWASEPAYKWARNEDEFTVYAWFAAPEEGAEGAVGGVIWTGWDPDEDSLTVPGFADLEGDDLRDALGQIAELERCDGALPFRVPTASTDPVEATRDAVRLVFGWLLGPGEDADVRVVLSHDGLVVQVPVAAQAAPEDADDAEATEPGDDAEAAETDEAETAEAAAEDDETAEPSGDAPEADDEEQAASAVEAPEVPAPVDIAEALGAALLDGGEALAEPFARWTLDSALLIAAHPGEPSELEPAVRQAQGYLAYARLIASTRTGGALAAAADEHLGAPHFEGAVPVTTADLGTLEEVAAIDRNAATDPLLDLLPRLAGSPVLDAVVQRTRKRIGGNAGLQLKLLLGLDARVQEETDRAAQAELVATTRPLLGDLPGATPARVRALWLASQAAEARRHEELSEIADTWTETQDDLVSEDAALATYTLLALSEALCSRVDHVTARGLLEAFVALPAFGTLSMEDRSEVIAALAVTESACGHRLAADARFAAAIERLEGSSLDDDAKAERLATLRRQRALNAIDARLFADADADADTPTQVVELPPEESDEDDAPAAADDDGAGESDGSDDAAADDDDASTDDADDDDADADDDDDDDADADDDNEDDDDDDADDDADADDVGPRVERHPGPREQLGDQSVDLVLAALGAESLEDAARELATDTDRTGDHALLLHLLWSREDLAEVEDAYLDAADIGDAHDSVDIELYRGLLLFMAGKDRDASRCVSRALKASREAKGTADRLRTATYTAVAECMDIKSGRGRGKGGNGRGRGRRRGGSLRQLEERLPASAHPLLATLQAVQAKPDEDLIDVALGVLPITLR